MICLFWWIVIVKLDSGDVGFNVIEVDFVIYFYKLCVYLMGLYGIVF